MATVSRSGVAIFSLLGIAKCLLHFHKEELEIREAVLPVKSMAEKIHIEFSTRW